MDATDERKKKGDKIERFVLLPAYVRMWAIATFTRVMFRSGKELLYNRTVAMTTVLTFVFPTQPVVLLLGFMTRIYAMLSSAPYLHDSQVIMDFVITVVRIVTT